MRVEQTWPMTFAASLVLLCCAAPGASRPKEVSMTRQPAVAGQFYPADPRTLTAMVDAMLADAGPAEISGELVAIQVPHAGYPYSGPTAARAFKLLAGRDGVTVVMFGTSHRAFIQQAAVYARGAWRTPLGEVPVDEELARAILDGDNFFVESERAHAEEHSLEVQLPFLQRVLTSFRIVPIMFLRPSFEQCERAGRAVARACQGRNVVLVASTDLYHGESYAEGKRTDSVTVELLTRFDPAELHRALSEERAQACGGYAVVAMMVAARELGADRATVLAQTNSNDVTGQQGGYCVGYSAVAFTGRPAVSQGPGDELSIAEQKSLLELARNTLETHVRTGKVPPVTATTARLAEKRGAFVTLHKHGELRGCIGYVEAVKPLYQAVSDMAVAASSEDPRFPPVTPDELDDIDIEITVLSPLRRLSSPDSVVVGRHGLVIRKGFHSGLLLPQVPVEQGWNREQFLAHTCR
ncbi:MAG: AmmeMemoRadiSam system protein B, partial [candidate division WOR-3 bacterium]